MKSPDATYYTKLKDDAASFELDLSDDAWFEFWHTHVDWPGYGNASDDDRQKHLDALFIVFSRVYAQATAHFSKFQCWCIVNSDSSTDAVYLHTKNPNRDNFPADLGNIDWDVDVPVMLEEHINPIVHRLGLQRLRGENIYTIEMREDAK